MFTRNDLLDIAVKMEKNGQAVYERAVAEIKNKELKALLQWMAHEEASHQKWFFQLKEAQNPESIDFGQMLPDVLQEMMGEKSLSLDDVDFKKITHATHMLRTFVAFEQDTLLFYEFLEAFIEGKEALAGLEKIILEESAHIDKLNEMIRAIDETVIPEENLSF